MTTRYYRIHDATRTAPETLLEARYQVSRVWVGEVERPCEACDAVGQIHGLCDYCDGEGCDGSDGSGYAESACDVCGGRGCVAIDRQAGVSVCRSLDDLVDYLTPRSPYTEGCVLVVLDGEELAEHDIDAADGALLVRPTRIVDVLPVPEEIEAISRREI